MLVRFQTVPPAILRNEDQIPAKDVWQGDKVIARKAGDVAVAVGEWTGRSKVTNAERFELLMFDGDGCAARLVFGEPTGRRSGGARGAHWAARSGPSMLWVVNYDDSTGTAELGQRMVVPGTALH